MTKTVMNIRIDEDIKYKAAEIFQNNGLTISDAVRILFYKTVKEGKLPFIFDEEAYEKWFDEKVREAMADKRPTISLEEYEKRVHERFK